MRKLIKGGYVVAFDGHGHRILKDGVVLLEDDKIVHVGESYDGSVDETINAQHKLICPGFINIHALASLDIVHFRIDGSSSGLSRSKSYVVNGMNEIDFVGKDLRTSALFSFVGLLKGGSTTSVAITAMGPSRWEAPHEQAVVLAKTAGELGARAYISHQYRSGVMYQTKDGIRHYHWDEEAGRAGLERGLEFCEEYENTYGGRIRTMLFPYQFDACSESLLRETKAAARERNLHVHMHTAQSLFEFHETLRRYGKTPVQYLKDIDFLDEKTILTHLTFTTLNPASGFAFDDTTDVEILAETATSLAHTPWIYAWGGKMFHSYKRFLQCGVNVAIGTDAFPLDMIKEMRYAALMGKMVERDALAVTAREVFNAATLSGAKALGREDIGRLSPGAKADILIVDLTGFPVALVDDPIKTLVYFASQRDIETVFVDGKVVVEGGKVPGIDERELARAANEANQRQKAKFVQQNPQSKSADELFPPIFPVEK